MSNNSDFAVDSSEPISSDDIEKLFIIEVNDLYYSKFPTKKEWKQSNSLEKNKDKVIQPLFFRSEKSAAHNGESKSSNLTAKVSTQIKLQSYYRKAVEYRIANSLEASVMKNRRDIVTFIVLVMSTAVSILLLYPSTEYFVTLGAIISAVVSALSGFASYMDFAKLYEQHSVSVAVFANLQRNLLNLLHAGTEKEQQSGFLDIAKEFASAINIMPMLDKHRINSYKSSLSKNRFYKPKLFKDILDDNLRKENKENVIGMSRALQLFPEPISMKKKKEKMGEGEGEQVAEKHDDSDSDDEEVNLPLEGELFTYF